MQPQRPGGFPIRAASKLGTAATRDVKPTPSRLRISSRGCGNIKGELVGNEDFCHPEGWTGPESCLSNVAPYGWLWFLAPS